jgi:excinuclease ABC subunit A
VETALEVGGGQTLVTVRADGQEREELFSQHSACPVCGISMPELQPRLFSFNSPFGACPECSGLGVTLEFDPGLLIPDPSLSFNQGAVATHNPRANWHRATFQALAEHFHFDLDTPMEELAPEVMRVILHGTEQPIHFRYVNREKTGRFEYTSGYRGLLADLRRRYLETSSPGVKEWLEGFMSRRKCPACNGTRLRPEALAVTVGGKNIHQASSLTVAAAARFFETLPLDATEETIARQILKEIGARLRRPRVSHPGAPGLHALRG